MSVGVSAPPEPKAVPDVPLTTRSVRIRKDMLKEDGTAVRWKDAWKKLRESLNDNRLHPVIRTASGDEINVTPNPRMYSRPWLERAYAKILDGDREIRERFEDCSTVLITMTGSGYNNQRFYAPADHYHDLDRSWTIPPEQFPDRTTPKRPIYRQIDDNLGMDYEYVMIDGVHDGRKQVQSGSNNRFYAHRHLLLYIDGNMTAQILKNVFYSVIDLHIQHCPNATREQHPYGDAIRWDNDPSGGLKPIGRSDRVRGRVTPAARDIASHLPDVHSGRKEDRLFAGAMYAVNKRSWSDSKGFRQAYRDRFEQREGVVHPDRWESDGDGELVGWEGEHGFIQNTEDESDGGFMAMSEPIFNFY